MTFEYLLWCEKLKNEGYLPMEIMTVLDEYDTNSYLIKLFFLNVGRIVGINNKI